MLSPYNPGTLGSPFDRSGSQGCNQTPIQRAKDQQVPLPSCCYGHLDTQRPPRWRRGKDVAARLNPGEDRAAVTRDGSPRADARMAFGQAQLSGC